MKNKVLSPTLKIPIVKDKEINEVADRIANPFSFLSMPKTKTYASSVVGDNPLISVTDNFKNLDKNTKLFAILHEEGHIANKVDSSSILNEVVADRYALKHLGKKRTYDAMKFFVEDYVGTNVAVAGGFITRMSELGLIDNKNSKNFIVNTMAGQINVNDFRKSFGLDAIDLDSGIKKLAKKIAQFKIK